MGPRSRSSCIHSSGVIGPVVVWLAAWAGCGTELGLPSHDDSASNLRTAGAVDGPLFITTEIVLQWDGGAGRMYPGRRFEGLNLSEFPVLGGGSLADRPDDFREAVRSQIERILDGIDGFVGTVRNTEQAFTQPATVVVMTQADSPRGPKEAGEGEFDAGDQEPDGQALVFGQALLRLVGEATWDEWVLVFANVAAHEIGHTLGFDHVDRSPGDGLERPLYINIMLEGHTAEELRREQRFLTAERGPAPFQVAQLAAR